MVVGLALMFLPMLQGQEEETKPADPKPSDYIWKWDKGTIFADKEGKNKLEFKKDKTIGFFPDEEAFSIYDKRKGLTADEVKAITKDGKRYSTNWANSFFSFSGFGAQISTNISGAHNVVEGEGRTPVTGKHSVVKISLTNLKIDKPMLTAAAIPKVVMRGKCSYKVEHYENGIKGKEVEEKDVEVKFTATGSSKSKSNLDTILANRNLPRVKSPEEQLEEIKEDCAKANNSNNNNNYYENPEKITDTVLTIKGNPVKVQIKKWKGPGASTTTGKENIIYINGSISDPNIQLNLANELGNVIAYHENGGNISRLRAEGLSDRFTEEYANSLTSRDQTKNPFNGYLPSDFSLLPKELNYLSDILLGENFRQSYIFKKGVDYYKARADALLKADKLVAGGYYKKAYDSLKNSTAKDAKGYVCKVIDSAEFYKIEPTPEPPK